MSKVTLESFIERSKAIHGDKYDYSLVKFEKCIHKVDIICKLHNTIFNQDKFSHMSGSGCYECSITSRTKDMRTDISEFITKAKSIHGDKYDYSLVKYRTTKDNADIICNVHKSIFSQQISRHLSGAGCPLCGSAKSALAKFSSKEKFIAKAKLVHGDKFDYSLVEYGGTSVPVKIICDKGHIFSQSPHAHLVKKGCSI